MTSYWHCYYNFMLHTNIFRSPTATPPTHTKKFNNIEESYSCQMQVPHIFMSNFPFLLGIDGRPPSPTKAELNQIYSVAQTYATMDRNLGYSSSLSGNETQNNEVTNTRGQISLVVYC